jgi:hypothetical protein
LQKGGGRRNSVQWKEGNEGGVVRGEERRNSVFWGQEVEREILFYGTIRGWGRIIAVQLEEVAE